MPSLDTFCLFTVLNQVPVKLFLVVHGNLAGEFCLQNHFT